MIRRFSPLLAACLVAVSVSACGSFNMTPDTSSPVQDKEERDQKSIGKITGDGIVFGGPSKVRTDDVSGIAVNSYLWRASLDSISFMPLASADPFGGVIITDWYSTQEAPSERFKLTVYVLDRQLRADGIRVAVFKQVRDSAGWSDATVDPHTGPDLENEILTRARQLRLETAAVQ